MSVAVALFTAVTATFVFVAPVAQAKEEMSCSQLIELLIAINIIPADKIAIARAACVTTTTPPPPIKGGPTMYIDSPRKGDVLRVGDVVNIKFRGQGPATSVALTLVCGECGMNGSEYVLQNIGEPKFSEGQYTWVVPRWDQMMGGFFATDKLFIRAEAIYQERGVGRAESGMFTILDSVMSNAKITLRTPNGGEQWKVGEQRNISWTLKEEVGWIHLDLVQCANGKCSFENSPSVIRIATWLPAMTNGSYLWSVGKDQKGTTQIVKSGGQFAIKATLSDGTTSNIELSSDVSDKAFVIDLNGMSDYEKAKASAIRALAQYLLITDGEVVVAGYSETSWMPKCGLGAYCIQMMQQGYVFYLNARGAQYQYRTNSDGSFVERVGDATATPMTSDYDKAKAAAINVFARSLGVSDSVVMLRDAQSTSWERMIYCVRAPCLPIKTQGYIFTLVANGQTAQYRTNSDGSFVERMNTGVQAAVPAPTPVPVVVPVAISEGDVNGDGKIAAVDARMVFMHLIGGQELTSTEKQRADVNRNQRVDQDDAESILAYAVSGSFTSTRSIERKVGDLNSDNAVTSADAFYLAYVLEHTSPVLTPSQQKAADVDGDGKVTRFDRDAILAASVGSITIPFKFGDINSDGKVTAADALYVEKYLAKERALSAGEFYRADINQDKRVDATDRDAILKASVGSIILPITLQSPPQEMSQQTASFMERMRGGAATLMYALGHWYEGYAMPISRDGTSSAGSLFTASIGSLVSDYAYLLTHWHAPYTAIVFNASASDQQVNERSSLPLWERIADFEDGTIFPFIETDSWTGNRLVAQKHVVYEGRFSLALKKGRSDERVRAPLPNKKGSYEYRGQIYRDYNKGELPYIEAYYRSPGSSQKYKWEIATPTGKWQEFVLPFVISETGIHNAAVLVLPGKTNGNIYLDNIQIIKK